MEDNNMNSCLMLAVGLYTPVDLGSIFDSADYKGTGLELDTHITVIYAQGKILPRRMILEDIKTILGDDWSGFEKMISKPNPFPVLDMFELGSFENDSDYIVLKLKPEFTEIYNKLRLLNLSLRKKYGVSSEFSNYSPHITLAELVPGTAQKYLRSECLMNVLKDSMIDIEDLVISFGISGEVDDRKQYFLTQYKNIDRYFRLKHSKEDNKEVEN